MAEKNQRFSVRHIATGRKVPVHPSMYKDPTWLAENGYMKMESLKPFERSAISSEPLPPLPPISQPIVDIEALKEQVRKELAEEAKKDATEATKEQPDSEKSKTVKPPKK